MPVTVLAAVPNVLAVRRELPVRTVSEFIAYVKATGHEIAVMDLPYREQITEQG